MLRRDGQLAAVASDTYVNDPLGIAFRLPPGWIVRDQQEVAATAEGRLLTTDAEELNAAFRSLSDAYLPLVTISAPPWDDPIARLGPHELSPVAVVQLEHVVSDAEAPTFDLLDHVITDLELFHEHVADFRLIQGPRATSFSGCAAVTYLATYTMLHADAVEGCPAREHATYVLQDSAVWALRLCDFPERDPRLAFDFSEFLTGVCFR